MRFETNFTVQVEADSLEELTALNNDIRDHIAAALSQYPDKPKGYVVGSGMYPMEDHGVPSTSNSIVPLHTPEEG